MKMESMVPDMTVEVMKWGMVLPNSNDLVINGRLEDIDTKPFFRSLLQKKRCVITINGYYEWKVDPKTNAKIPFLFVPKGSQ